MMPQGFPFSCALKVLCEGGSVEFSFRAGGVSVDEGGGSQLTVYEPGRIYQPEVATGDAYERQTAYFVDCVRRTAPRRARRSEDARLAVQSLQCGAPVARNRRSRVAGLTNTTGLDASS